MIVQRVVFGSAGEKLEGDLYLPDRGAPPPAVVVAGSWTTVKEQMAGRYARGLAERGIAALAFDFRGYGTSGGIPRDVEDPAAKVADLVAAADFLSGLPEVDPARLGAVGICAGAGYAALAAAAEPRLRSLGLVAPWLHDAELVASIYGGEAAVRALLERGERAELDYRRTGVVRYVPAVSTTDETAAMFGPFDYYLDPGRGAIPAWPNRFAEMAWPRWLGFDPISAAGAVTVPTVLVHSPDAAIPDGARRFVAGIDAPARLQWLTGSQFDFYDQDETIDAALGYVVPHLLRTLSGGAMERKAG